MSNTTTLCPPAPLVAAAGFLGSVKELRDDLLGAFDAAHFPQAPRAHDVSTRAVRRGGPAFAMPSPALIGCDAETVY